MENKLREEVEVIQTKQIEETGQKLKRAKEEALDIGVMNMAALFKQVRHKRAIDIARRIAI